MYHSWSGRARMAVAWVAMAAAAGLGLAACGEAADPGDGPEGGNPTLGISADPGTESGAPTTPSGDGGNDGGAVTDPVTGGGSGGSGGSTPGTVTPSRTPVGP